MTTENHLPQGGHYASWRRAGDWLFTAGIVPRDPQHNIIGKTVEAQTEAVFSRLQAILAEAGATLDQVIKVQVYLADLQDMGRFNSIYAGLMGQAKPVRTTTGCQLNGVKIELDVVAYLGDEPVCSPC